MKRGLLGFPLLILLIQVISAQFYSGYGSFSLANFFDRIDPQTIILVLLFLIFFAFIFYALSRIFKDPYGQANKGIAGVIAFAISAMIIYGLYRTGFDLGNIFYNLGFSADFLYPILAIIILVFAILIIRSLGRTKKDEFGRRTFSLRRGLGGFFMVFGLFIILLTIFTEIFYEKGITLIIGIVSLVIGLLLWRRRRKNRGPRSQRGQRWPKRSPSNEPMGYGQRAKELRDKQTYLYYKGLEEQQRGQEQQRRRDQARELRREETRERKVKERYTRRFGKRAWRRRERQGI